MKIYRTCNPSKHIKKEELHEMLKVRMTCGGGMGGAGWYEYIYLYDCDGQPIDLQANVPVHVTNYLGEEIMLNPKYIVKVTHISIVKVVEDITGWKTYGSGPDGKQYLKFRYLENKPFENVTLIDAYQYADNKDALIKEETLVKRK